MLSVDNKTTVNAHIAILASGRGSNAKSIIKHFKNIPDIDISLIVTNNPNAGVLDLAIDHDIETFIIPDKIFLQSGKPFIKILKEHRIDHIVLAGFLWRIPPMLVNQYKDHIINIHPSLLPKYGGKGMYGHHVHHAVSQAGDTKSGITIHLVNRHYDEGKILFQKEIPITPYKEPIEIARKVLRLEHKYYPLIIEAWIRGHDAPPLQ